MKFFLLKSSLVKKFSFWFFDCSFKTTENLAILQTKVEEDDPTDLLPKFGAEKMTRKLSRGCQLDL